MKKLKNIKVMRTTKLTTENNKKIVALSLLLLAISTISFSQMGNFKEFWLNNLKEKIFQTEETNSSFMTVSHFEEAEWVKSPAISRTIFVSSVEVSYEETLEVEDWMKSTFENSVENAIEVEEWMTAPFETLYEESVPVENWMNSPFGYNNESNIEVEEWMTVPFEASLEEPVAVENWMTTPMAWNN